MEEVSRMEKRKQPKISKNANPSSFDSLSEDDIFVILDKLGNDSVSIKSFSLTCKSFYSIESHHRRNFKPLRQFSKNSTIYKRYPFITHLDLSLAYVEDETLNVLSATWGSSLKSVTFPRWRFVTSAGLCNFVANCVGLVELNVSSGVGFNDTMAAAIAGAKNLETLWLPRCRQITDDGIESIAVGCKKLRVLALRCCSNIGDKGVESIASYCKEIRVLDITGVTITAKCIPRILKLPYLEELYLEGCHHISDDGLKTIKESCKSIKTLHIEKSSHAGFYAMVNLGSTLSVFPGLQSLFLDHCSVTTGRNVIAPLKELSIRRCLLEIDESLSFLVNACKDLRKLDITFCRKRTYVCIDSITKSCKSLTSLKMESCGLVSKMAFTLIGRRCVFLEELDVTNSNIDDQGLKSISRCSNLLNLKLRSCVNITDVGLEYVGRGCPNLKELDLHRSCGITDRGVAEIALGCVALERISIAYNDKITDASLSSLSKCTSLSTLDIRGCQLVRSEGLLTIAVGCRQLSVLNIKKCYGIAHEGILKAAKSFRNLKQINLSFCKVNDSSLLILAGRNRIAEMTLLDLDGLTPKGLKVGLLECPTLQRVKLRESYIELLSTSFVTSMEDFGCVFEWKRCSR